MKTKIDLKDVEQAFLAAMAEGYAQSAPTKPVIEIPGMKQAPPFKHGDYLVLDQWITSEDSDMSDGMTLILHLPDKLPVWCMHYGGYYPKTVIHFLRECLRQTYVVNPRFNGGRGPDTFNHPDHDDLQYLNRVICPRFTRFEGREVILNGSATQLGYHWYQGQAYLRNC